MNCKKIQELISTHIDNKLSLEEASQLMKHLENCSNCKQFYNDLSKLKAVLSNKHEVSVSSSFTNSTMQKIYELKNKKQPIVTHVNIKKYFAIAASFICVVATSAFFIMQQPTIQNNISPNDFESIFETYTCHIDNVYENDVTSFLTIY